MYRAKATGKSRFRIFGKKLQQMVHDALQLENDLKTALKKEQLTLYYHPIVFFLKMDKSLVNDINRHHENLEIAKAIITLAQNLDLEVIAEGIESNEQLETLQGIGCDFIQGYYFSKPVDSHRDGDLILKEIRHK
ncbi:MAG: EAL domain-containing protein [Desulfobacter sp.]